MDYADRLLLALEWLAQRYERRGHVLTDSDVFTAAELFTTTTTVDLTDWRDDDHRRLFDDLYEATFPVEAVA